MKGCNPSYSADWQTPKKRPRDEGDSYQPEYHTSKRRRNEPHSYAPQSKSSTHSRKERKTNPSTRIHSLKKLLAGDVLPPERRREKERELSGLVFDQEKERNAKATRQMISRYHMVRFFERKKAERKLRKLQKLKEDLDGARTGTRYEGDRNQRSLNEAEKRRRLDELEEEVHEAEVDVKYTIYSPLAEKYIGIFVEERKEERGKKGRKLHAKNGEQDERQRAELQRQANEVADVARVGAEGSKPPLWYETEKCMEGDDERAVKRKLQALRDRQPAMLEGLAVRSGNELAKGAGQKRKPGWLEEDGHIDPADLDSDADEDIDVDGRAGADSEDEPDGGFFA